MGGSETSCPEPKEGRSTESLTRLCRPTRRRVPAGKLLVVERGARWGEATIVLTDPPEWMTVELEPIPVPERVSKFHPALT